VLEKLEAEWHRTETQNVQPKRRGRKDHRKSIAKLRKPSSPENVEVWKGEGIPKEEKGRADWVTCKAGFMLSAKRMRRSWSTHCAGKGGHRGFGGGENAESGDSSQGSIARSRSSEKPPARLFQKGQKVPTKARSIGVKPKEREHGISFG